MADIGNFENPIFDIDLKFTIFALEKNRYPILGFNFRYWLAKNPIFKTGKKLILDTQEFENPMPDTGPPPLLGPYKYCGGQCPCSFTIFASRIFFC